jgi:hypothetical protein
MSSALASLAGDGSATGMTAAVADAAPTASSGEAAEAACILPAAAASADAALADLVETTSRVLLTAAAWLDEEDAALAAHIRAMGTG